MEMKKVKPWYLTHYTKCTNMRCEAHELLKGKKAGDGHWHITGDEDWLLPENRSAREGTNARR